MVFFETTFFLLNICLGIFGDGFMYSRQRYEWIFQSRKKIKDGCVQYNTKVEIQKFTNNIVNFFIKRVFSIFYSVFNCNNLEYFLKICEFCFQN